MIEKSPEFHTVDSNDVVDTYRCTVIFSLGAVNARLKLLVPAVSTKMAKHEAKSRCIEKYESFETIQEVSLKDPYEKKNWSAQDIQDWQSHTDEPCPVFQVEHRPERQQV